MLGIAEVEAIASFYGIPHSALRAGQVVGVMSVEVV